MHDPDLNFIKDLLTGFDLTISNCITTELRHADYRVASPQLVRCIVCYYEDLVHFCSTTDPSPFSLRANLIDWKIWAATPLPPQPRDLPPEKRAYESISPFRYLTFTQLLIKSDPTLPKERFCIFS